MIFKCLLKRTLVQKPAQPKPFQKTKTNLLQQGRCASCRATCLTKELVRNLVLLTTSFSTLQFLGRASRFLRSVCVDLANQWDNLLAIGQDCGLPVILRQVSAIRFLSPPVLKGKGSMMDPWLTLPSMEILKPISNHAHTTDLAIDLRYHCVFIGLVLGRIWEGGSAPSKNNSKQSPFGKYLMNHELGEQAKRKLLEVH